MTTEIWLMDYESDRKQLLILLLTKSDMWLIIQKCAYFLQMYILSM